MNGIVKSREVKRADREALRKDGWLTEILRGWYAFHKPEAFGDGETALYTFFWPFVRAYMQALSPDEWCLSAEVSLARHAGQTAIPRQIVVIVANGGVNKVEFAPGLSMLVYPDAKRLPQARVDEDGLRMMPLEEALTRAQEVWFREQPHDAEIAMRQARPMLLAAALLGNDRISAAGRLVGAYEFLGEKASAAALQGAVQRAGHEVTPTNPFTAAPFLSGRLRSPHAARVKSIWSRMRGVIETMWPDAPGLPDDGSEYAARVQRSSQKDAYHSLTIEGYQVNMEQIREVGLGELGPDALDRNVLATQGYNHALKAVQADLAEVLSGSASHFIVQVGLPAWHQALFSPNTDAGLISTSDLLGYRRQSIYLRGSRHVPPHYDAIPDAVESLFECLETEPHPAVRALLGHFVFTWIHPYADGNGRVARFLMNIELASGGYPWTTLRAENRDRYMSALEQASGDGDVVPFAEYVLWEMEDQASTWL